MCFVNTGNSSPNISQFAENHKGTMAASNITCFLLTAKIAAQPAGYHVGCQCFCKPVMCSPCVHVTGDVPYWYFHNVPSSSCHIACLLTGGGWWWVEVISERAAKTVTTVWDGYSHHWIDSRQRKDNFHVCLWIFFNGKKICCIFGWGLFGIRHKQLPSLVWFEITISLGQDRKRWLGGKKLMLTVCKREQDN